MSEPQPDDTVAFSFTELKELLREAFEAGGVREVDAYWSSSWIEFEDWFARLEWDNSNE
jgi:hypothetical protein